MIRFLFVFTFLISSFVSFAQGNDLIYKKIIPGMTNGFEPLRDGSGYALAYQYVFYTPNVDIGIWTDSLHDILIDSVYYNKGIVVYNTHLEPKGVMVHQNNSNPNLHPITFERTILNFINKASVPDQTVLPMIPSISNFPANSYGQSIVVEFNALSESNFGLLNFSSPNIAYNDTTPYFGFDNAANANMELSYSTKPTAILGDSILISYLSLYDTQYLNATSEFTNLGGQLNVIRTQLNLETEELTSQLIGSETGSLTTIRIEPSKDMSGLYRTGIVRGNNTPVSASGTELEMSTNDSLYRMFITKETVSGETEWLTELYAYNNTFGDTLESFSTSFYALNSIYSIFEKNEAIYVSSKFMTKAMSQDTLIYRDFTGQNSAYSQSIPYFGQNPDIFQIPYAEARIYKLDEGGNIIGKLGYVYTLWGRENGSSFSGFPQNNTLFEVADKMAWINGYYAVNDTTTTFTYTAADGSELNTSIDLPAGQGSYVLWLDDDLNILDHWLIPFQNNGVGGLTINAILPYNADTLLIQGSLTLGTSSDLNPFGDSEVVTATNYSSFFAFYTAPEILTNTKRTAKPVAFTLFPNPTTGALRLSGLSANVSTYTIYDLSGRALRQGTVADNETIQLGALSSGMYILSVKNENGWGTRKFVVE